jgi:hypothetical protein
MTGNGVDAQRVEANGHNAPDLAGDERWVLATRVAASRSLAKATQLRDLLLYLAEKGIRSPGAEVSEQEIGSRVLGRRPDYDPQADNIVRVQMRHLRQKLDEYFTTDGQSEPMVLSIPKGSRIPCFEPRNSAVALEAPPPALPVRKRQMKWPLAALALVLLAFVVGRLSVDWIGTPPGSHGSLRNNPFWSRLFTEGQEATIVLADSNLAAVQDLMRTTITLSDYISGAYRKNIERVPDPELRSTLAMLAGRQYTSLADATVAGKLYSIGTEMGARVAVRYARHMNVRDFGTGNFILIGSKRATPWAELFETDLNFIYDQMSGADQPYGYRNKAPRSGEPAAFYTARRSAERYETFAAISLLTNASNHKGSVLLLNGATMEGTEAAGEFCMNSDFPKVLQQVLGASPRDLEQFEILLKIAVVAGAPHKVEIVAWRKPGDAR